MGAPNKTTETAADASADDQDSPTLPDGDESSDPEQSSDAEESSDSAVISAAQDADTPKAAEVAPVPEVTPAAEVAPAAAETPDPTPDPTSAPAPAATDEPQEGTVESVRAYETPIFAAMFADWEGPAVRLIGSNLHRADADTMVFDGLMWRPSPAQKAPALRFHVAGDRHAPVITAVGELKAGSAVLLTTPLRHILRRRPRQMIVDLAGITAVSQGGLRALLDVRQAARNVHVDFWLRSPSEPVRELLQAYAAQLAARSRPQTARRVSEPGGKPEAEANGAAVGDADDELSTHDATRSRAQVIAAKLPGAHRRAEAQSRRVLEGVVIDAPTARPRPWWSSHGLLDSLRRVGTHQHSNGHGAPTSPA